MLKTAVVSISGLSPYSASRVIDPLDVPKLPGELPNDYEERTWRNRMHVDADGEGLVPAMAFKMALDEAVKRFAGKIKGQGNTMWTKYFTAGVMVSQHLGLGVTREDVSAERVFVPSDGIKGSGKRVWKKFPIVHKWGGAIEYLVLDPKITKEVFEESVQAAFSFIGIGRWRPEKGGLNGRAAVKSIKWRTA